MKIFMSLIIMSGVCFHVAVKSAVASLDGQGKVNHKKVAQFSAEATKKMFNAIIYHDIKDLNSILESGQADVNARMCDCCGSTALELAICASTNPLYINDKVTMINLLLTHGADQYQSSLKENIRLPIHWASDCEYGASVLINALLSFDKKLVNAQDGKGNTPLSIVLSIDTTNNNKRAISDKMSALRILLEYDADIALVSSINMNTLENLNAEIIAILKNHNAEKKMKILLEIRAIPEMTHFPPGLVPLIIEYI